MRRALALLTTLSLLATAGATAAIDLSLEAMLERADAIVYGTVADVTADVVPAPDGEELRTRVTIDVERDLSSPDEAREELVLSFLGGRTAGGEVASVEGVPTFTVGEHVLVLAYLADEDEVGEADEDADEADDPVVVRPASPIVGVWQGVWRLGPSGLGDARGRLLTPGPQGLAADGAGGDLTEVLDALAGWREGTTEIAPDPAAPAPGDAAVDDGPGDGAAPDAPDAPMGDASADAAASPEPDQDETADGADEAPPADAPAEDAAASPADATPGGAAAGDAAADGGEGAEIRLRAPESDALRRTIEAAAAAWREAGADVRVTFDDAAPDAFVVGDPARLGPDALALAVHPAGTQGTEVRVAPGAVTRTDVVAYELAVLAGAPPTDAGLLSGRFAPDRETPPTAADAAALRAAGDAILGDLDLDGDVDFYDLALLAEAYGGAGTRSPADLNGDGRVDDADVELLRERYEFLPPSADPPAGTTGTTP